MSAPNQRRCYVCVCVSLVPAVCCRLSSRMPAVVYDYAIRAFSFRVLIALNIDDQRHHFNIVKVLLQVKIQPDYVTILLIFTPNKSIDLLSLNIVNELMQTIKILRQ